MHAEVSSTQTEEFYNNAVSYWSEVPATIDGMLGGFGHISETDIRSSRMLLKQLFHSKVPPGREYALDCGAGIGRISKFLLTNLFNKVDMVEQNSCFLQAAKSYLGPSIVESKIGQMFSEGLQTFEPELGKYDVIWVQWVLGHLTDDDFVKFFKSCQKGLKPNGVIVAKENITSSDDIEVDEKDSSVTRPLSLLKLLFEKANLDCYRLVKQINFPKGLYTVYMFVLKPKKSTDGSDSLNKSNTPEDAKNAEN
ncbi:N-terminal Xaa-Pro-Lys N-methyltransferase 1-B [Sitophilus oryzae]|uniref:Alpha N-terminal protein methyltransferase 1 n=1 Tax=Sitophilus oryzae TaxID=7048 RepID=A0A6J2XSM9_SITOR|nr:N-terminal Xaa-Pro-Lys N-methyltransferase 1-B [Sitophilus oryzae]